jgi:diketogulonate reductase-like aldo/keto reductase
MLRTTEQIRTVALPSGELVPQLGLGTWHLGENPASRGEEIATLRLALDLGITLIDTAEMYGEGLAESLIGEAINERRDEFFLVTKVYPHNASRQAMPVACERSLRRLRTDRIDLYLLHWRGSIPLSETVETFMTLQQAEYIRYWGVSNFDVDDMAELWKVPGASDVTTDQILYNLARRGPEWGLMPWLRGHRIPVMAYSPIEQARLLRDPRLAEFARGYGMTPAQAALAWLLAKDDVIAIPKTGHRERLIEDVEAMRIRLTPRQLAELDLLFPPPDGPRPLETL